MMRLVPVVRLFFSKGQRQRIERLACRQPASLGWSLPHWSCRSLAQAAIEQEYVKSIDSTTIGKILRTANLRPHQSCDWKTTIWDEEAVARALKILWYYERVESLWQRGEVLLAGDEKPNLQVLERTHPTHPMQPGRIERQAFDYYRHGTIHLLAGLTVSTGHMWAECLDKNDGEHFRPALRRWLHPYSWAKRIHVILDNGSSHISGDTLDFFEKLTPRVQVLFTPSNASWLNQAEALLEAFSERYLLRGSWSSRPAMVQHILNGRHEYNQRFAHPFAWNWSCRNFLFWLNNTPGLIRCKT
jgi:DDE superfamily endonuclease